MGTRSIIKFYEDGEHLCSIYQQYDGYIEGVGKQLKDFLKSAPIVNGIFDSSKPQFNGAGCLVAQFIAKFKEGPGSLYIYPEDCGREEYNYKVDIRDPLHKSAYIELTCDEDSSYNEVIV